MTFMNHKSTYLQGQSGEVLQEDGPEIIYVYPFGAFRRGTRRVPKRLRSGY